MLKRFVQALNIAILVSLSLSAKGAPQPLTKSEIHSVCSIIESYPVELQPHHYGPSEKDACTPIWENGIAPWDKPENRKALADYGTAAQKSPSTLLMHQRRYRYSSAKEKAEIIEAAKIERAKVSAQCCGTNSVCKEAMDNVGFRFCERNPDPSQPDRCVSPVGTYNTSVGNFAQIVDDSIRIARRHYSKLSADERRILARETRKRKNAAAGDPGIYPGWVTISSYVFQKSGASDVSEQTLRHELGHACSHVQRQLALKDSKHSLAAATTFLQMRENTNDDCEISDHSRKLYASLFRNQKNATQLVECLAGVAENESTASANVCPRKRLEEGFADVLMYLSTEPDQGRTFKKSCAYLPSSAHIARSKAFQCLVLASPSYRTRIQNEFGCTR